MPVISKFTQPASPRETLAMPEPQIAAFSVEKAYRKGDHLVPVLHGVDISIRKGEFLSIVGELGTNCETGSSDSCSSFTICFQNLALWKMCSLP